MKQSISYTFILNLVITFIFVCFAIVFGTLSYFKAFKANTIIINALEKYEGDYDVFYKDKNDDGNRDDRDRVDNCLFRNEIKKNLGNLGYKTPFAEHCKTNRYSAKSCTSYINDGFNVYLYYEDEDKVSMSSNSVVIYDYYKKYQYGVQTYMYVDVPILSSFLKISLFGKTRMLYTLGEPYSILIQNAIDSNKKYDEKLDFNGDEIVDKIDYQIMSECVVRSD